MKVLLLSDIHSNYEALLAVAHAEDPDEIWCLGDLVGFGPQPAEVVQWVRHHAKYCVLGNHDYALAFETNCGSSPVMLRSSEVLREMNRRLLSHDQKEFLRNLPRTLDISVDGFRFRLAHAEPNGDLHRFDLTPEVSDEVLQSAAQGIDAEFIVCGHTHMPMVRKVGEKTFINPGAVGMQFDGDWRASCAVWKDGHVKLHRVKYDVQKTVERMRDTDAPVEIVESLVRLFESGCRASPGSHKM